MGSIWDIVHTSYDNSVLTSYKLTSEHDLAARFIDHIRDGNLAKGSRIKGCETYVPKACNGIEPIKCS